MAWLDETLAQVCAGGGGGRSRRKAGREREGTGQGGRAMNGFFRLEASRESSSVQNRATLNALALCLQAEKAREIVIILAHTPFYNAAATFKTVCWDCDEVCLRFSLAVRCTILD